MPKLPEHKTVQSKSGPEINGKARRKVNPRRSNTKRKRKKKNNKNKLYLGWLLIRRWKKIRFGCENASLQFFSKKRLWRALAGWGVVRKFEI